VFEFSYLDSVKPLVSSSVYNRGLKYFLDGEVVGHEDLTLDYWREYRVLGTNEYFIKTPLIHLALAKNKFKDASKVVQDNVSCTCGYFSQYGVCKHIVAVFAHLDQEFNLKTKATKQTIQKKQEKELLDSIFSSEIKRQIRNFEAGFDNYLVTSRNFQYHWLEEFVVAVNNDCANYVEFLEDFSGQIQRLIGKWENELKILNLIPKSLIYGNKIWWDFWSKFFPMLEERNRLNLYLEIWQLRILNLTGGFTDQIDDLFQHLTDSQKRYILTKLQEKFQTNKDVWLDFAFVSRFWTWFEENLNDLDPIVLIRLAQVWSEKSEEIEIQILNQVKIWSDFLQAGDYDEIIRTFQTWQLELGRSDYFEQAIEYYKQNHPKKRGFLKKLEG
jgi:hypothetical protein